MFDPPGNNSSMIWKDMAEGREQVLILHAQDGELELVLAKTPAPGEDATPVLMGKQLYFPQQRTDEDLLNLLQPYQNAQVAVLQSSFSFSLHDAPARMHTVLSDDDSPTRVRSRFVAVLAGKE